MVTTIQISEKLQKTLSKRKLYEKETYEEIIWDLIEDSLELSEETKRNIEKSEKEIKEDKVYKWEDIKKELKINVWTFFTNTAKEQLKQLSQNTKEGINSALERVKVRPFSFVKRLRNSKYYRLRVGSYRLILNINSTQLIILVIELGHRKDIYK